MKLRKFELRTGEGWSFKDLLNVIMSAGSSSEDVLKSVTIGAKIEEEKPEIWLTAEEHAWLLLRLNKTEWNAQPANRKIIAGFITYLRELKEEDVQVTSANA